MSEIKAEQVDKNKAEQNLRLSKIDVLNRFQKPYSPRTIMSY